MADLYLYKGTLLLPSIPTAPHIIPNPAAPPNPSTLSTPSKFATLPIPSKDPSKNKVASACWWVPNGKTVTFACFPVL